MLTVYGVNASPFVRKVRVVLEEKNLPYTNEPVFPMNPSPEYKKISPLGKIPALKDGDRTLADSSVICAYIEKKHPSPALYPSDAYDYGRALWFEEYSDSALVQVIGPKIFFPRVVEPRFFNRPTDEVAVSKAINEDLPPLLDYLEGQIGSSNFLVGGAFSIADIAVCTQFANLNHAGVQVDAARWPNLARYTASILGRPVFKKLVEEEKGTLGAAA